MAAPTVADAHNVDAAPPAPEPEKPLPLNAPFSLHIERARAKLAVLEAQGKAPVDHGTHLDDPRDEPADPEAAKPDETPEPAKADAAAPEDKPEDKREVPPAERAAFTAERRKFRELARKARSDLDAERLKVASALDEAKAYAAKWGAVEKAQQSKDAIGLLKALGLDPKTFNEQLLQRWSNRDPRIDEMEARVAAAERREAEARQAHEAAARDGQQRQERERAMTQIRTDITTQSKARYGELAADPGFIQLVYMQLRDAYDHDTGETIPVSEAAEKAVAELRAQAEWLDKHKTAWHPAAKVAPAPGVKQEQAASGAKPAKPKFPTDAARPKARGNADADWLRRHARALEIATE